LDPGLESNGTANKPESDQVLWKGDAVIEIARGETSAWIAPPGAGKSALQTEIAIHCAAQRDWRGHKAKAACGVVIFALERADLYRRRLQAYRMRDGLQGLAHMTKQYSPEAIKKLAPAFAFLSTANPSSLGSIERAAGYAVPLLQSGLEIDPMESLLLGTALTRAGATSTKSGTWLREMALRAMPGSALMSDKAFAKHEDALHRLGLVDENDKPTWFTDGKPDLKKMLDIGGANAAKIPLTERAALERQLFGAQGGGGFALLADPAVREQILSLRKTMDSPEFKNRWAGFSEAYKEGSPVQQARTTLADFNIAMMDLGSKILPAATGALKDFDAALKFIKSIIPGSKDDKGADKWKVGTRALEGAGAGALIGWLGGPGGAVGGALIGGAAGAAEGIVEGSGAMNVPALKGAALGAGLGALGGPIGVAAGAAIGGIAGGVQELSKASSDAAPPVGKFSHEVDSTGTAAATAAGQTASFADAIRSLLGPMRSGLHKGESDSSPGTGESAKKMNFLQGPKQMIAPQPISFSLNVDGTTLAHVVKELQSSQYEFPGGAPAANGLSAWNDGDHNMTTT
jgi:AAA domain